MNEIPKARHGLAWQGWARSGEVWCGEEATFAADVTIRYNGRVANAKSIMGLASLAAEFGSVVEIEVSGSDEDAALARVVTLIEVDLAQPDE